jgi:hypothetical protein
MMNDSEEDVDTDAYMIPAWQAYCIPYTVSRHKCDFLRNGVSYTAITQY